MLKHPLFYFILKALAWLPLALIIWLSSHTLLTQALQIALNPLLKLTFSQVQAMIKQHTDGLWVIRTRILTKEQPKDTTKRYFLHSKITNPAQNTLMLPLLWILLLALGVYCWKTWLISHIVLASVTVITSFLSLFVLTARLLANSVDLQIEIFTGYFQAVYVYPTWLISILSIISIASTIVMLFSPLFIIYYLQKAPCDALLIDINNSDVYFK